MTTGPTLNCVENFACTWKGQLGNGTIVRSSRRHGRISGSSGRVGPATSTPSKQGSIRTASPSESLGQRRKHAKPADRHGSSTDFTSSDE